MTATIGLLSDCNFTTQRGNILLSADELITYTAGGAPVSSNRNGSKLYDLPCGFFVTIADDISRSHQVVSYLYNRMSERGVTVGGKQTTDLVKKCLEDTAAYVRTWIRGEICADYGVSEDEFLHDKGLTERENIRADLKAAVISTELTIGGFGYKNSPILFYTNCIDIQEEINPGIHCGGSGALAALNWLNFRGQNCFTSTQRSYFHLREAMHFARLSPMVGASVVTMLLQPDEGPIPIGRDKDQLFLQEWGQKFCAPDDSVLDSQDYRTQFSEAVRTPLKQSASERLK